MKAERTAWVVMGAMVLAAPAAAQPSPFDFQDTPIDGAIERPDAEMVSTPPWLAEVRGPLAPELANARTLLRRTRDVLLAAFREAPTGARDPERRARAHEILRRASAEVRRLYTEADVRLSTMLDVPTSVLSRDVALALRWRFHLRAIAGNQVGATEDARRYVRECPTCAGVADAWLQIGQATFQPSSLLESIDAFTHVETSPGVAPNVAAFARYMIGWVQLNLGQRDAARASFQDVIRRARAVGPQADMMGREATRDLARLDP